MKWALCVRRDGSKGEGLTIGRHWQHAHARITRKMEKIVTGSSKELRWHTSCYRNKRKALLFLDHLTFACWTRIGKMSTEMWAAAGKWKQGTRKQPLTEPMLLEVDVSSHTFWISAPGIWKRSIWQLEGLQDVMVENSVMSWLQIIDCLPACGWASLSQVHIFPSSILQL